MTNTDLLKKYSDLLIVQYRNQPKATGHIQAFCNIATCDGLPLQLQRCFDLDNPLCVGKQLEIIGRIVGVKRDVPGLDLSHTYFELTTYAGTPVGTDLAGYDDSPVTQDVMLRYNENATYTMNDFEFNAVIKMKIVYNFTYASLKNIVEAMWRFFGTNISGKETGLMQMTFESANANYNNPLLVAQYLEILPCPMAVEAVVVTA